MPRAVLPILLVLAMLAPSAWAQGPAKPKLPSIPNTRVVGAGAALEGDLLTVGGRKVRILGIDAPDPGQTCLNRYGSPFDCFAIARQVLAVLVDGTEVECTIAERDRNGLDQGECRARGIDLGAAMVSRGWAFAYRSLTPAYQSGEAYAQTRRIGLWSGIVEKPWQWRSRKLREQGG